MREEKAQWPEERVTVQAVAGFPGQLGPECGRAWGRGGEEGDGGGGERDPGKWGLWKNLGFILKPGGILVGF